MAFARQSHSRSALAGLLWSDRPEADVRTILLITLSQLRKAVGDDDIVTRRAVELRTIEPWPEAGHRQLMKLLAAEGKVSSALAQASGSGAEGRGAKPPPRSTPGRPGHRLQAVAVADPLHPQPACP